MYRKTILLTLLAAAAVWLLAGYVTARTLHKTTELNIHNPYNWNIALLIKCDYRPAAKQFSYRMNFTLPKQGHITIDLPHFKKCEVWPRGIRP